MSIDLVRPIVQVHNPVAPTPTIGELVAQGIVLERAYAFRYCSPTRRSMLSGRFPNHLTNTQVRRTPSSQTAAYQSQTAISECAMELTNLPQ